MDHPFPAAFSNENMSLNGGGVEVSLPPVGACCGWVHFGGEGGVVQARSWRKPIGNDPFWDCVLLLPGIKKTRCRSGGVVGERPASVVRRWATRAWRVVHGLSTRPEGRGPVRRTRPQIHGLAPGLGTASKRRAAAVATPRHAAFGVAWPMARNKASRARFACTFASRSVMVWASLSRASKVTPGRKYRSACGSDFSFS